MTTGRIPETIAKQISEVTRTLSAETDFLERQDRIDKILLGALPDDLLDQMLRLQPDALPPWLSKLPVEMQSRIRAVNRSKDKTWAHKLVELEMISAEIAKSNLTDENGQPIGVGNMLCMAIMELVQTVVEQWNNGKLI